MKKLYPFFAMMLLSIGVFAQAPERMSYQAVIRDASNALIQNQNVGVRMSILQGSTSGAAMYVETHTPSTNANGLVSLEIGSGSLVSGNFSNIDWANGPYFIKAETDPNGGTNYTITGTTQLLAVPYAFHATTVENDLDEQSLTYNSSTGVLGISNGNTVTLSSGGGGGGDNWGTQVVQSNSTLSGSGTTGAPLAVVGDLTDDQSLSFNSGTGALSISGGNSITLPVTTGGDNWGSQVVQSNSTLSGSGTSGSPLVVVGDLTDDQNLSLSGTNLSISGGNTLSLAGISNGGWTVSGNNIYNPNTGNVGVGITNPSSKFHVSSALTNTQVSGAEVSATNSGGNVAVNGLFVDYTGNNTLEGNALQANGSNTGTGWSRGVYGTANGSTGSNRGVQGATAGTSGFNAGVAGFSTGTGGVNTENHGVFGQAIGNTVINHGVLGVTSGTGSTRNAGVRGEATGTSTQNNWGAQGYAVNSTNQNIGISGLGDGTGSVGVGVVASVGGSSSTSYGIYASDQSTSLNSFAGFFDGDVTISGDLDVTGFVSKGGGTFRIDHPTDPENKYLVHSFVESPDMMNIYNGNIVTDANGFATVEMPDYFEAANKDFRYQLTVIGTFAQAIVMEKISGNTFVIQTSVPNVEVSWQVTGVRADKYSDAHRVEPEEEKAEPGTYVHPELFGAPKEQSVNHEHMQVETGVGTQNTTSGTSANSSESNAASEETPNE